LAIYINTYKCSRCRIWWKSRFDGMVRDECPECARMYDPAEWDIIPKGNSDSVFSYHGTIIKWMIGFTPERVSAGLLSLDGSIP